MHSHDDVLKWKHFPRYWSFVRGIHRSPVNSPHKGQWHGALMFSVICVWIYDWINNREAVDLGCYRAHYDVTVMHWESSAQDIAFIVNNMRQCNKMFKQKKWPSCLKAKIDYTNQVCFRVKRGSETDNFIVSRRHPCDTYGDIDQGQHWFK